MLNTKSLGKAVGIQNQGVQDNSRLRAGQGGAVGVIIGQFKRGALDKAFPVTIENYRARLGYDPTNPHYVAIQDLFMLGYPLVWILRVVGGGGGGGGVCVPEDLPLLPNQALPRTDYAIDYRINDGDIQRWTLNSSQYSGSMIQIRDIFTSLFSKYSGIGVDANIDGGGGGVANFQIYNGYLNAGANMPPVELTGSPIKLDLFAVSGQINDPITAAFGVNTITAKSCGERYWDGL